MTVHKGWLKLTRPAWTSHDPRALKKKKAGLDAMWLIHKILHGKKMDQTSGNFSNAEKYVFFCDNTFIIEQFLEFILSLDKCDPDEIYIAFDGNTLPGKADEVNKRYGEGGDLEQAWTNVKEAKDDGRAYDEKDFNRLLSYITPGLFQELWDQLEKLGPDLKSKLIIEVAAFENDAHLAYIFKKSLLLSLSLPLCLYSSIPVSAFVSDRINSALEQTQPCCV